MPAISKAACHSELVQEKFVRMMYMKGSPLELVNVFVVWQVVKHNLIH